MQRQPTNPRNARHCADTQSGFSFIELIVVMGVLAVLIGMVMLALGTGAKAKRSVLTRQRLSKAAQAAHAVRSHFGAYAPTDPRAQAQRFDQKAGRPPSRGAFPANRTNEGGESLVLATYAPSMRYDARFHRDPDSGDFVNTDEDALSVRTGRLQTAALLELRDEWGQPLVYIEARDYHACASEPVEYVGREGRTVSVRPWRSDDGLFAEPESFQIFSMGPDGVPNTDDDIKHWAN